MNQEILNPADLDVVILCGGLGTRFRKISNKIPKSLAPIGKNKFLDILIAQLFKQGFRRFILCIRYKGMQIKKYYYNSPYLKYLVFSEEKRLLGTGGAIKNAMRYLKSKNFLVINGDTFCELDYKLFLKFHYNKNFPLASMVLTKKIGRKNYGMVKINKELKITAFNEKSSHTKAEFINAGIYLFNKSLLSLIPEKQKYSLEYKLFPSLINSDFFGYVSNNRFYDIGTKFGFNKALEFFQDKYEFL